MWHGFGRVSISILDSNQDQIISSSEIVNAATALQQLDKNLNAELSTDEYRPQHPGGHAGGGRSGAEGSQRGSS